MFSIRTAMRSLTLALCMLAAGASLTAAYAQSSGAMGMSDTAHGKMKATHDTGAMAKTDAMGGMGGMGGMSKSKDAMGGKMGANHSKVAADTIKPSPMRGDSAMKDGAKATKKRKAKPAASRDSSDRRA